MRRIILAAIIIGSLIVFSCKNENKSKTNTITSKEIATKKSLDSYLVGSYKGTIPCADCDGIEEKLTLNSNKSFTIERTYLGKEKDNKFYDKGNYSIDNGIVILSLKDAPTKYKLANGYLLQLDMEGKEISGENAKNYKLVKN